MATGADPITLLTGSGVVDQGLDWFKAFGDFFTNIRGQDVSSATSRYNADASAGASRYAADKSYQAAMLDYQAAMQQIQAQYDIDLKNYGLNVAQFNAQQRVNAAQIDLARKGFGLDVAQAQLGVDQFNFGQRAGVADRKMAIIDMLARRSGPSDWVAYNSILNQLDPPSPERSATIDPFKLLDGLYQPTTLQMPEWAQGEPGLAPGIVQPLSAAPGMSAGAIDSQVAAAIAAGQNTGGPAGPAATWTGPSNMPDPFTGGQSSAPSGDGGNSNWPPVFYGSGNGTGGSGTAAPNNWGYPNRDAAVAAGVYSGVPSEAVAGMKSGDWSLLTTGTAGPSDVGAYGGFNVWGPDKTTPVTGQIAPGTPIWLQKLAAGGMARFPNLLVGDKPRGRTGYEEIVINLNPEPDDALMVLDRHDTKKVLDGGGEMLTKASKGGLFDPAGARMNASAGQGPAAAGGSILQKLYGGAAGNYGRSAGNYGPAPDSFSWTNEDGRGSTLFVTREADFNGPWQVPSAGGRQPDQYTWTMPDGTSRVLDITRAAPGTPTQPGEGPSVTAPAGGVQPRAAGPLPMGQQQNLERVLQQRAIENMLRALVESRSARTSSMATPLGRMPAASGGDIQQPQVFRRRNLRRANSGGIFTANTDPFIQTNQYSPEVLGSQPFIQKARGQMAAPSFQGVSAPLSNPSIGVEDMPSLVNLQIWRDIDPTEKDALEELYNRGLGMDMRDVMERSRRAAPVGASFGPARYGR